MNLYDKISAYIESNRDQIVEDLIRLVAIPSVSLPGEGKYPFGDGVEALLLEAKTLFAERGYELSIADSRRYGLLTLDGETEETIGLFAHGDVVPVNEAEWVLTKPFTPLLKEGCIIGRGVDDNKGALVGSLYALMALKECGIPLRCGIQLFVGGNEECGMADIREYVATHTPPTISLVPDSGYPYSEGEKGILRLDFTSRRPFTQVREIRGGQVYNTVLDNVSVRLVAEDGLAAILREQGAEVVREGDTLLFRVRGQAAHAGAPQGSVNALERAAAILLSTKALGEADAAILRAPAELLADPLGGAWGVAGQDGFGPTTAACGMCYTMDGRLTFTLDVRYGASFDHEWILETLRAKAEEYGFDTVVHSDTSGFLLERDEAVAECLLTPYRHFSGRTDCQPFRMSGGTYARHLPNAYAVGTSLHNDRTALHLPAGHGGAHQADEALAIDGLLGMIKVLASTLVGLDAHLTKA